MGLTFLSNLTISAFYWDIYNFSIINDKSLIYHLAILYLFNLFFFKRSASDVLLWLDSINDLMDMNVSKLQKTVEGRGAWCAAVRGIAKSWTRLNNWTRQVLMCNWLYVHFSKFFCLSFFVLSSFMITIYLCWLINYNSAALEFIIYIFNLLQSICKWYINFTYGIRILRLSGWSSG